MLRIMRFSPLTLREWMLPWTIWFFGSQLNLPYLTLRLLMSYIYGAPILDVSRSHTTTQHSR